MGDKTGIAWTDATWNPIVGCSRVSAGCEHCYAERLVHRGLAPQHRGLTKTVNGAPHWTGEVRLVESALDLPLRWKKPRRIFVNSLSDLFHEKVPEEWVARIFDIMLEGDQHTYQVLTKRPERMQKWVTQFLTPALLPVILSNIHLGVSVEDQATADARIPLLLQTPAAVRWVSVEPCLGPVDLSAYLGGAYGNADQCRERRVSGGAVRGVGDRPGGPNIEDRARASLGKLTWVVIGGDAGRDMTKQELMEVSNETLELWMGMVREDRWRA